MFTVYAHISNCSLNSTTIMLTQRLTQRPHGQCHLSMFIGQAHFTLKASSYCTFYFGDNFIILHNIHSHTDLSLVSLHSINCFQAHSRQNVHHIAHHSCSLIALPLINYTTSLLFKLTILFGGKKAHCTTFHCMIHCCNTSTNICTNIIAHYNGSGTTVSSIKI